MLSKLIAESSNKWQPAVLVRDSVKQEASTPESVPPIDLRLQEYSPVQAVRLFRQCDRMFILHTNTAV